MSRWSQSACSATSRSGHVQADPGPLLAMPAPQIGANLPRRDGSAPRAACPSCARPSDPLIYRNGDTRLRRRLVHRGANLADC